MPDTTANIVHLTTVHPRNDIRIFLKECVTLKEAGHTVSLIVADGLGDEVRDGITIHDVGRAPDRFRRMLALPGRARRKVHALGPDLVHFHDPELLPVAWRLKRSGFKVIYDAHEDLPRAVLSKSWIRPVLRRTVAWTVEQIENFVAARIDAVVAATPHIAERFEKIAPRAVAVSNYPMERELEAPLARPREPTAFCYAGAVTRHRGAVEIVRATADAGGRLLLAGPFERGLESELQALPEWAAVDYRGVVGRDEVREMMASASAGLLFFHPEPNHVNAMPNKLFEYLSAGLPVLCSDFPLWQSIVEAENVGRICDPTDPDAIATRMREIIADPDAARAMGERGRELVHSRYSWKPEGQRLVDLYEAVL
ncbi:glycosyltransferase family 4 protein [Oceaniradius stylonematis]|uniref:glycosyltransferase family 4 protein n=1 Tax=Oceaniradius stylonematis TaxID=2184161 RepID=UPI00273D04AF|nr:glycosyltransferase family 4 protein [Oceaniradius stylonematis]